MAVEIQELRAVVRAEIDDALKKFDKVADASEVMEGRFDAAASAMKKGGIIIGGALAGVGVAIAGVVIAFDKLLDVAGGWADAAQEDLDATRKLEAVLKTTGGAVGVTADEVTRFASTRQLVTDFADDATVAAAAVLATFKHVREDAFMRTLAAGQDMAALFGGDLQGSVLQLGKALENPTVGLTALRRSGVSFTEQQMEQIKALQEAGRLWDAQQVILTEVEHQFGGVAEATAHASTRLKNTWGEIEEGLGGIVLPLFEGLAAAAADALLPLAQDADAFDSIGAAVEGWVTEHHDDIVAFFNSVIDGGARLFAELQRLQPVLEQWGPLIQGLGAELVWRPLITFLELATQQLNQLLTAMEALSGVASAFGITIGQRAAPKETAAATPATPAAAQRATTRGPVVAEAPVVVESKEAKKEREKAEKEAKDAAEKHAEQVKDATADVRDFGIEMQDMRDKLSPQQMRQFAESADELKTKLAEGKIDVDEFNFGLDRLEASLKSSAEANGELVKFGTGLNDLRDTLSPELLDSAAGAAKRLRDQLQSGSITMDQYKAGLATINDRLTGVAAGDKFMEDVANSSVEQDTVTSFGTSVDTLKNQLLNGQITLDQFNVRLDVMRQELQAATLAQDAFTAFEEAQAKIPAAAGVVEQFGMAVGDLQAQFNNGEIGLEQYKHSLSQLNTQAEKAAALARQQALMKGDFAGAGLDFRKSVQQQFMEQAAQFRQGQFDSAVNAMVQQMLRLNGFIDQTGSSFQNIGQQVSDFGDNLNGMAGDMKGGGEQAGQALNTLASFLASKEGQIASLRNQIQTLQQFLTLESLGYRRRQEIIGQIESLSQAIIGLMQMAPPVLGDWRSDPAFVDPGLEGADDGGRGGRGMTVQVNSIFPPSAADRRMLMDAIVDELSRRGWRA